MKFINDILHAVDSGLLSILILLNLTATFDTISHPVFSEPLLVLELQVLLINGSPPTPNSYLC